MDRQQELQEKYAKLQTYFKELGSVAAAFSGGVDSTFLLRAAHEALGDKVIAVTASIHSVPKRELADAKVFCEQEGICQYVCVMDELAIEGFAQNPKNRCYICKSALFTKMKELAAEQGMLYLAEGSNLDDLGDYRPGLQAIAELEVKSPLRDCGFTKADIRELSRELGLPTWDKPSMACLASRFAYGETITKEKLAMVERAEQLLFDYGFLQARVRVHGQMARIEVLPEQFELLLGKDIRETLVKKLTDEGFAYISMDLKGFRSGSMNETLEQKKKED